MKKCDWNKYQRTFYCDQCVCKKYVGAGVYVGSVGWWRSCKRENHFIKKEVITCVKVKREFFFVPLQKGIHVASKCGTKGWYFDLKYYLFLMRGVVDLGLLITLTQPGTV